MMNPATLETLFTASGLLVMPFWALMILAPHWRWTRRIIGSAWIAAPAALLYLVLVLPRIGSILAGVSQPELASVAALFGEPYGTTVAWAHFLAFDLLVGRWAYLDGREREISAWLMAPVIFFTFMLGPVGFLAYLLLRRIVGARSRVPQG